MEECHRRWNKVSILFKKDQFVVDFKWKFPTAITWIGLGKNKLKLDQTKKGLLCWTMCRNPEKVHLWSIIFFRRRLKNKKRERLEFNNSTFHIFLLSVPFIFLIRPIFLFYSSLNLSHVLLYKIHILWEAEGFLCYSNALLQVTDEKCKVLMCCK